MNRRTFDLLAAATGLLLAVILIISGALLTWAHDFVGNEVHTQLAAQKIFFPSAGSPAIKAPEFAAMRQYAGQQLTTGAQAQTYADHFIANHLIKIGGGKTYAQVSAEAIASPGNTALKATAATLFQGETLRGLLLNAYAFATIGMIAGIAAIAAFIAAALMAVLGALGLVHARRASPAADTLTRRPAGPATAPQPATVAPGRAAAGPDSPNGQGRHASPAQS